MENSTKITVRICVGTTCHIMGGSELTNLTQHLTDAEQANVDIAGIPCLGACKNGNYGKAPFAQVNNKIIEEATPTSIIAEIDNLLKTGG